MTKKTTTGEPVERHAAAGLQLPLPTQAQRCERLAAATTFGAPDEEGAFEGVASVYASTAFGMRGPTRFRKGAFKETLRESRGKIPLLWQHDDTKPIGVIERLAEGADGLEIKARLSKTALGQDVLTLLRDGALNGLSIGFNDEERKFEKRDGDEEPVRLVTKASLIEVSVVTFPADAQARVRAVHSEEPTEPGDGYREAIAAEVQAAPDIIDGSLAALRAIAPERHEGKVFSTKNLTALKNALTSMVGLVSLVDPAHVVTLGKQVAKAAKKSFIYGGSKKKAKGAKLAAEARREDARRDARVRHAAVLERALRSGGKLRDVQMYGMAPEEPSKARLFDDLIAEQEQRDQESRAHWALVDSLRTIVNDTSLSADERGDMARESVLQYLAKIGEVVEIDDDEGSDEESQAAAPPSETQDKQGA